MNIKIYVTFSSISQLQKVKNQMLSFKEFNHADIYTMKKYSYHNSVNKKAPGIFNFSDI